MMTGSDSPEDFEAFAISTTPSIPNAAIAPNYTAPQHGPRPLPLFLKMLWQQTRNDTDFRLKAFAGLHKYQTAQRVPHHLDATVADRKSVVQGTGVSVSVDLGGRRTIKKKKNNSNNSCLT